MADSDTAVSAERERRKAERRARKRRGRLKLDAMAAELRKRYPTIAFMWPEEAERRRF